LLFSADFSVKQAPEWVMARLGEWFAGFAAWVVDGAISLRLHSMQHAQLAFLVAMVFLAAGIFYRRQQR
jgi:hypothetical protein